MWAAAEGNAGVVQALIEAGADIHARTGRGFTAFLFASRAGSIAAARVLLAGGGGGGGARRRGGAAAERRHAAAARDHEHELRAGGAPAARGRRPAVGRGRVVGAAPTVVEPPARDWIQQPRAAAPGRRVRAASRPAAPGRRRRPERPRPEGAAGRPEAAEHRRRRRDAAVPGRPDRRRRPDARAAGVRGRSVPADGRVPDAADGRGRRRRLSRRRSGHRRAAARGVQAAARPRRRHPLRGCRRRDPPPRRRGAGRQRGRGTARGSGRRPRSGQRPGLDAADDRGRGRAGRGLQAATPHRSPAAPPDGGPRDRHDASHGRLPHLRRRRLRPVQPAGAGALRHRVRGPAARGGGGAGPPAAASGRAPQPPTARSSGRALQHAAPRARRTAFLRRRPPPPAPAGRCRAARGRPTGWRLPASRRGA